MKANRGGEKIDIKRIIALIEGKDFMQLKAVLLEEQVQDIAELIDELEPKSALLSLLPKDVAVDVFSYLNSETQVAISRLVNENELKEIVDELFLTT